MPLWALIAVLAVTTLPGVGEGQGDAIDSSLLPRESAAVRAELLSKERFPVPLVARTHVVHDNRAGLPLTAAQDAAALARDVQDGRFPELDGLAAVVPIPNTVFEPGLRTTTVLYGLHFRPGVGEIAREEFFRSLVAPVIALATVAVAYATVLLCTLGSRPVYHPGKTFPPVRETKPPRLPGIPT